MTAVAATWLAFMAASMLPSVPDVGSVVTTGLVGAVFVLAGFAATDRTRRLRERSRHEHARTVLLALVAGVVLGLANLAANVAIASAHPDLRALLSQRFTTMSAVEALVRAPVLEEVTLRLFFMSVIAWIVSSFTRSPRIVFVTALVVSAVIFAVLHLDRPMPADQTLATLYSLALVVKYSLAGLTLGWIFWRWGLPSAIASHFAVNATHLLLQDRLFS